MSLEDLFTTFPNAYPHHGFEGVDIPWDVDGDHYIIVTNDGDDEFAIGIYLDGHWMEGEDPDVSVVVIGADNAVTFVNDITDLQPEGTDWGAWVVQWTNDAMTDQRIEGLV